jgi:hypothetical protein
LVAATDAKRGGSDQPVGVPEHPSAARVTLDLDPGDPISGCMRVGGGPSHPFRGWLELAGKLESARAPAKADSVADDEHPLD